MFGYGIFWRSGASHRMTMHLFSKAVAFLLLGAVIAAPLAAQAVRPSAGAQEPPAGCHEDSGKPSAPGPTSHQCCQGSHHPAILQQSSLLPLPLQAAARGRCSKDMAVVAAFESLPKLVIVSGDPPVVSPLRV